LVVEVEGKGFETSTKGRHYHLNCIYIKLEDVTANPNAKVKEYRLHSKVLSIKSHITVS
jgi:hypothetical protein